jgi:hypothetical protein
MSSSYLEPRDSKYFGWQLDDGEVKDLTDKASEVLVSGHDCHDG